MFSAGVFLHYCSDLQKTLELALKKEKELITTRLWAYLRNPNYFGELLIYGSFALLSNHWIPCTHFATMITLYWLPSMYLKERSISRYPGFAAYKQRSYFFIPFIW
eukprot:Colp12_sorted_trinity150504_noHs@36520